MNRPPLYPAQITHIFLHKVGQPPPTHPHLVFEVDPQKRVNFIQPVGDCVIWSDVEVIEGGVSVARHAWIHTAAERVVGVAGVVGVVGIRQTQRLERESSRSSRSSGGSIKCVPYALS